MLAPSRQRWPEGCSGYGAEISGFQLGLRLGRRVAVLRCPGDRVPRPPEVPVVLVVPAVDRRVGSAEVLHREEPGGGGDVEALTGDELPRDGVPARDRRALPPTGDVGLSRVRTVLSTAPIALTSLKSRAHAALVRALRPGRAELRRGLEEEWLHPADPGRGVEQRLPRHGVVERPPVPGGLVRHPLRGTEAAVALACCDHRRGRGVPGSDALRLRPTVRNPGEEVLRTAWPATPARSLVPRP